MCKQREWSRVLLHTFDIIYENTTKLNPIFDALFFSFVDSLLIEHLITSQKSKAPML
jgi:hypothetical protein